jgi:hypothetical protein
VTENQTYRINPKIYPIKYLRGRARAEAVRNRSLISLSTTDPESNSDLIAATGEQQ